MLLAVMTSAPHSIPDPEVVAKARRRKFTSEYKRKIVEAADACSSPGDLGALLRREGLYSSHLSVWRQQRDEALATGLAPRKRGRKPAKNPLADRVAVLERTNARLEHELFKARTIIEVQKKVALLLGNPLLDVEASS